MDGFAFSMTMLVLAAIGMVRNHIVYGIRTRRLFEIKALADKGVADDAAYKNVVRWYEDFDKFTYNAMVFDLTRWTYKQFYPNPVE